MNGQGDEKAGTAGKAWSSRSRWFASAEVWRGQSARGRIAQAKTRQEKQDFEDFDQEAPRQVAPDCKAAR